MTPYAKHRYGYLFNQIDTKRSKHAKHFHATFLLRRFLYCSLPLWMFTCSSLNFIFIIIVHTIFLVILGAWMNHPHETRRLRRTELLNEWFFSLLLYESFLMTDLAANATNGLWISDMQVKAGQVWLWTIAVIFIINLGLYFMEVGTGAVKSIYKLCCAPKKREWEEYEIEEQ